MSIIDIVRYSSLAQSVEHAAVNRRVVGSSPTGGAKTDRVIDTIYQLLYRFFMSQKPCFKRFF